MKIIDSKDTKVEDTLEVVVASNKINVNVGYADKQEAPRL